MEGHDQRHHHADMLSVEEALEQILSYFSVLEPEEKPVLDALGQTLAEEIRAPFDIPPVDNSAMDGYAVHYEDVQGASPGSPKSLRVIGQVAAGHLPDRQVVPGTAVRIMTGAPIPPGADTVVPFEETDEMRRKAAGRPLDQVEICADVGRRASVRPAGEDVAQGQRVLDRGTIIRPAETGVLAAVGRSRVQVVRRPKVAILSTGDELLEPGAPLEPGKIYDSNSFSVAAGVLRYGGIPCPLGIARDTLEEMHRKLDEALDADLLVTSAGVSRGDYDMVKDVLAERGQVAFWSVRMRPAKPLAFGSLRAPDGRWVPHIGLPGNPVSALVAFEEFCRPAILKMLGRTSYAKPTVEAILRDPIHNTDERRVYARAVVTREDGQYYASLTGPQGSNLLTSMSRANGLAICPEDVPEMRPGQRVQVQMLDWPEEVLV